MIYKLMFNKQYNESGCVKKPDKITLRLIYQKILAKY